MVGTHSMVVDAQMEPIAIVRTYTLNIDYE